MPDRPTPTIDAMLCHSLYAASLEMSRVYRPMLEKHGLTYPQYLVLVTLWGEDSQPVSALGGKLGLESNTLTPLLKRMETAGLLSRRRSDADERRVLATLTPKGKALQNRMQTAPEHIRDACGLEAREIRELKSAVDRLRANLRASLQQEKT